MGDSVKSLAEGRQHPLLSLMYPAGHTITEGYQIGQCRS